MGETHHPNNEIVSSHVKKENWGSGVCYKVGGAQKHGVLKNKSGTKGCR